MTLGNRPLVPGKAYRSLKAQNGKGVYRPRPSMGLARALTGSLASKPAPCAARMRWGQAFGDAVQPRRTEREKPDMLGQNEPACKVEAQYERIYLQSPKGLDLGKG